MYNPKPIKSQEEASAVLEFLISGTMETLKITRLDAELRVAALRKSDIMKDFNPDDKISKMMVDAFMTSPAWDKPEYQAQIERLEKTK